MAAAARPAGAAGTTTTAPLVWIGLPGAEVDDGTRSLLEAGVGGVVLFAHNIAGPEGLRALADELRRHAPGGLRIAIDHEGGHIVRLGAPLTRFPSAMAIGATGSEELAERAAEAAGRELIALGIDVNLAPVVDVAVDPGNPSIGVRAFGSEPELVARMAAASVRGFRKAGIACVAKHFPGHGRTPIDSHLALPTISGGADALRATDLPPFRAAIEAGVDAVMVAHVAVDGLTDGQPSTLSPAVMRALLRDELGFAGLVVTDALRMRAVADTVSPAEASLRAVAAGADVVMPLGDQHAALAALAAAAADGALPASSVEQALERIARLDATLRSRAVAPAALPSAGHAALAAEVARRSLTRLSSGGLLPLRDDAAVAVVELPSRRPSLVEEALAEEITLAGALRRHLPRTSELPVDADADERATLARAQAAAERAEILIIATRDAWMWPRDLRLVGDLIGTGVPTVLVALRSPYDLTVLDGARERIAAYADVPATLTALADALAGRADWPGTLPVAGAWLEVDR